MDRGRGGRRTAARSRSPCSATPSPGRRCPGEIVPGHEFYDYEDKYLDGAADLVIPADLPDDGRRARSSAWPSRPSPTLRCDGMARVDFFYEEDGRGLLLNEVNTIPGFTPISMYPKLWARHRPPLRPSSSTSSCAWRSSATTAAAASPPSADDRPKAPVNLTPSRRAECAHGQRREPTDVTYCLALRLDEGLIFLADTRTNAGVDNVGSYRKLHILRPGEDRVFVLQSAGSLATTHEVLDRIGTDLAASGDHESLATVSSLYEAAIYIGRLNREVTQRHWASLGESATATFILGGQITGERPDLMLLYPEGNYIHVSDERPFFQIGESKYGKFMLELAVHAKVDMDTAIKIALSSMISTAHANLSVGPPYDLGVYRNGSLDVVEARVEADSPYLATLQGVWMAHFLDAIHQLPALTPD